MEEKQKKQKFLRKENENGITLIALVITIIVLLILAGVSISMLTGENGILNQAAKASDKTERESLVEQIQLDILGYQAENTSGDITREQLDTVLGKYFETVPEDYTKDTVLKAKDEYGGYEIAISEIYSGNIEEKIETIDEAQSCVGYYADFDVTDGTIDGIIYADQAVGGSGEWPDGDDWGTYVIPKKDTGLKEYYLTGEEYTGDFGTAPVLAQVENTSGEDRFYVMALTDVEDDDANKTFCWYDDANGNLDNQYSVSESANDFGSGSTNTTRMIDSWTNVEYGAQDQGSYPDVWGVIQDEVADGWFVPSKSECAAFGAAFGITNDSSSEKYYVNYNLSDWYWSSSQGNTYSAYYATFDYGYMSHDYVVNNYGYVRLSTTF